LNMLSLLFGYLLNTSIHLAI